MLDLSRLNSPQREAVTAAEGPILVLAGAGSGKTRVIAHRVAWLLSEGASPDGVLAVTFTNKAAAEMRERIASLAGPAGACVQVSTFHAFGRWLLAEEHRAAGLPRRFGICDAGDQIALVKRCMREVKVDDRRFDARRVLWRISRAKNALKRRIAVKGAGGAGRLRRPAGGGEAEALRGSDDYDLVSSEVFPRYQAALRARRTVDFDDLIGLPVELLRRDSALGERWRARFRHLLVDEVQDTNACQLELLGLLAPEGSGRKAWRGRSLCAVGDDDQAIYGWRGAEVRNILRFDRHFPGAREVRLEQNYRSTGRILACANGVIEKAPRRKGKRLWTAQGEGEPVRVVALEGEEAEAAFVAGEIARGRADGRPASDFAVLYRLNAQSRPFEEALREVGIPHFVHGGQAFFDRAEVRDLLAYLKVCESPEDEISLGRIANVPARGIGDASLSRVHDWAVEQGVPLFEALRAAERVPGLPHGAAPRMRAFVEMVERTAARFGEGRLAETARALVAEIDLYAHARASVQSVEAGSRKVDAIDGLLRSIEVYERGQRRPSLHGFLQRLALDSRDEEPADGEGAALMTLHAAKGLEFEVVFLAGVEEDLLPCAGIQGEPRDLEEERRLAYVGITRARERLFLTRCAARARRGKVEPRTPSRFLGELPAGAFEVVDPSAADRPDDAAARSAEVLAGLRSSLAGLKTRISP